MPPKLLFDLSLAEIGILLRSGQLSATQITKQALVQIDTIDSQINTFIHVTRDRALADADLADRELRSGHDRGPLHGIPYGLKDIFNVAGLPTTCHSKLMINHSPTEDSAVVRNLKAGGAVFLGKLATHEFALGGPSFDLPFPPARNPWNLEHFTGGSSSGSAAAVAAGLLPVALGSDTTGSIRGPAFYCGTVGLKPTYGLVSRRGVFPLSYSLDHCGPLTWRVADAAIVMQVIAGFDPRDPSSAATQLPDFTKNIGRGLDGLRIGYARAAIADAHGVSPEVIAALDRSAQTLAQLGATVEQVTLPDFELFTAAARVILSAEAFSIHEDNLKSHPRDFGRYTYQRIAPGAGLTAADLVQAHRLRRELAIAVNRDILGRFDAIVAGSGLGPAPRISNFPPDWPPNMTMQTLQFNITGNPALAIPIGLSVGGLPLGMQIVGRAFDEPLVLQIGAAFEAVTGFVEQRPDLVRLAPV